jgi:transcriptional regulator with XRE-family HTH domain
MEGFCYPARYATWRWLVMPRGAVELRAGAAKERLNAAGERVRERRLALGLTMEQFCAAVEEASGGAWNPDRRDVYRVERGTRKITDLELVVLARAAKTTPADLIDADVEISARDPDQPRIAPRRTLPKKGA